MEDLEIKATGYLIKNINDKIKVKADADLSTYGLTLAQSSVLGFLYQHGGEATQKEAEIFFEVSHPTMVGIISRMEQRGFLKSYFDPSDRRSKIIYLTDTAKKIGKKMRAMIRSREEDMTKGLSQKEVNELNRMLNVIYKNIV